jgi:hypothetical protein
VLPEPLRSERWLARPTGAGIRRWNRRWNTAQYRHRGVTALEGVSRDRIPADPWDGLCEAGHSRTPNARLWDCCSLLQEVHAVSPCVTTNKMTFPPCIVSATEHTARRTVHLLQPALGGSGAPLLFAPRAKSGSRALRPATNVTGERSKQGRPVPGKNDRLTAAGGRSDLLVVRNRQLTFRQ